MYVTQPLKMSTRKIPGSKAVRCVRLTTYHLLVPNVKKIRGLNLLDPHGPVQACGGTALLYFYVHCLSSLLTPLASNCVWPLRYWQHFFVYRVSKYCFWVQASSVSNSHVKYFGHPLRIKADVLGPDYISPVCMVLATKCLIEFSWNPFQEFFTKICLASGNFVHIGSESVMLYLMKENTFYSLSWKIINRFQ
jgi:hypothetical protein